MNVTQYSLHYVTCAPANIEMATPDGLGGDTFTKYALFDLLL